MRNDTEVVKVDAFAEGMWRCRDYDAIACIDVITAGTTVVTSIAQGRRTFCVKGFDDITAPRDSLWTTDAELASGGEGWLGPSGLTELTDSARPLGLRSRLAELLAIPSTPHVFVASLRNLSATAAHLAGRYQRIAVVAAGLDGEPRFEDEMAAAWMARVLRAHGYAPGDRGTLLAIERWTRGEVGLIGLGKSAESLRVRGLQSDLRFVLSHVDDVHVPCRLSGCEIVAVAASASPTVPLSVAVEELRAS